MLAQLILVYLKKLRVAVLIKMFTSLYYYISSWFPDTMAVTTIYIGEPPQGGTVHPPNSNIDNEVDS